MSNLIDPSWDDDVPSNDANLRIKSIANNNPGHIRYSKSSSFYLSSKKDFFANNQELLERSREQNNLYASQPRREFCKVCEARLPDGSDFQSHGIDYAFCSKCSHFNGKFEDTQIFIEELYITEAGRDYSKNYVDQDFLRRTNDIYVPKIDFLLSSLPATKLEILDLGCGAGYFVTAALLRSVNATGLDVSKTLVGFGNHQIKFHLKTEPLRVEEEQGLYDSIMRSNANVISAIGVIEHLREPYKFFEAFRRSEARFLYYSVPMFSLSAILESAFTEVFPRQLSGGHTHLFTETSLKEMNRKIGVKPLAEWRFGTDVMDLYRQTLLTLQKNKASQKSLDILSTGFGRIVDQVQTIFDENHFCSEIHCVTEKN